MLKIMTAISILIVPELLIVCTYSIFNVRCMSGNRVGAVRAINTAPRQEAEADQDFALQVNQFDRAANPQVAQLLERRRNRQVTFDNAYFRGEVQAEPGEEVV